VAIRECGADPFKFRPVYLARLSRIARPSKVGPEEQKRELARLVGNWVDDRDRIRFDIDASGQVSTSFTLYQQNRFRLVIDDSGFITLYDGPRFIDNFSYALDGQTLRLCVNSLYRHGVRVGDDEKFVTRAFDDVLFFDHGKCTVVTQYGEVVPASCAVDEQRGVRRFVTMQPIRHNAERSIA
jgi:hypothetical protein